MTWFLSRWLWSAALPLLLRAESTSLLPANLCKDNGMVHCAASDTCLEYGQCADCEGMRVENVDTNECVSRSLFSDWAIQDAFALLIWFFGAGFAVAAGLGGGGIFVPMGILLLRFDTKAATGLSQASKFGSSVAGLILNSRKRHPLANRPLIDFDMALFMAPIEMSGALVGVVVQQALPEWLVILLMSSILGFTAVRTFRKGLAQLKKDRVARRNSLKNSEELNPSSSDKAEVQEEDIQVAVGDGKQVKAEADPGTERRVLESLSEEEKERRAVLIEKAALIPWRKYASLFVLWLSAATLILSRGGKGSDSIFGIEACGGTYWALKVVQVAWLFAFSLFNARLAVKTSQKREEVKFPHVEGDVVWDWPTIRLFSAWTFVCGMVAGLIGVGGGIVLGPVLLELGILPQVSTATTATFVVLTSSSTGIMFVLSGLVPVDYACAFIVAAFFGTLVGKYLIDSYVEKYNLSALLVFILGAIIIFASVMVFIAGLLKYGGRGWTFDGLKDFC